MNLLRHEKKQPHSLIVLVNLLFWSFFVISSTIFCAIGLMIRLFTAPFDPNRRILQQFSCFWASLYIWFNPFWSVESLEGLKNADRHKSYVIVANHQSMADILILFRTFFHFKWIAKKSLFRFPLLGWNMWLNGYIPIERGDEQSRAKCIDQARRWLQKGSSILFFPEGTRSRDGHLQAFKPGAFRLALETGCPILPIVISGTLHAIPKHSILLHRSSRMSLKVLPPIDVQSFYSGNISEDTKKLTQHVHQVFLLKIF